MSVDFSKLLSIKADDVKKPKPLPAGTYMGVIKGQKLDVSRRNQTPYVRFEIQLTGHGEDILPEDMEDIDLSKRKVSRDFYITDDATYRLVELISSCDIPTAGRSLNEMLPDLLEMPVMLSITQRANPEDPSAPPFNDVGKVTGQVD